METALSFIKYAFAIVMFSGLLTVVMFYYNEGSELSKTAMDQNIGKEEMETFPLSAYKNTKVSGEEVLACISMYSDLYEIRFQTIAMQHVDTSIFSDVKTDYLCYGNFDLVEISEDPDHKLMDSGCISEISGTSYDVIVSYDMNNNGVIDSVYDNSCYEDNDPSNNLKEFTEEHAMEDHPGVEGSRAILLGHKVNPTGSETTCLNPYYINPLGTFSANISFNNKGDYCISFKQIEVL